MMASLMYIEEWKWKRAKSGHSRQSFAAVDQKRKFTSALYLYLYFCICISWISFFVYYVSVFVAKFEVLLQLTRSAWSRHQICDVKICSATPPITHQPAHGNTIPDFTKSLNWFHWLPVKLYLFAFKHIALLLHQSSSVFLIRRMLKKTATAILLIWPTFLPPRPPWSDQIDVLTHLPASVKSLCHICSVTVSPENDAQSWHCICMKIWFCLADKRIKRTRWRIKG